MNLYAMIKTVKHIIIYTVCLFSAACASQASTVDNYEDLMVIQQGKLPEDNLSVMPTPPPKSEDPETAPKRTEKLSEYDDVQAFMTEMVKKHKVDNDSLQKAFENTVFDYSVIELMDKPAEKRSWSYYHERLVSKERVSGGVKYMKTHKTALDNSTAAYKVPQNIITAIIGIETTYGTVKLKRTAVQSLSTFAFEYPRRADYFRGELASLFILAQKEEADPLYYMGSYAGAVGIPQFMPSNILAYAVDGDGDKHVDIVSSHADAIASVANYLSKHGWSQGKSTVALVKVTKELPESAYNTNVCSVSQRKTVKEFKNMGIELPSKYKDTEKGILAKLYEDEDEDTFVPAIFFENACPINKYNRSLKYTAAISLLAEEIAK